MSATDFAIKWWRERHQKGYFPRMTQHLDWKIYDEMRPWFLEHARPQKDDVALEIGCGYGQWMIPLSRLVNSVYGFDIHPSLVIKAKEKFEEHKVTNCSMWLGDGKHIPFAEDRFSLVYSISVFQHMPRAIVRGYIQEADRVMLPGAKGLFHFRAANGIGPYSEDIYENHTGDWSVGWTQEEISDLGQEMEWSYHVVNLGDVYLLVKLP